MRQFAVVMSIAGAVLAAGEKAPAPAVGEAPPAAAVTAADAAAIELTLPPVLYAVPGLETNIYFENTVLVINPANLAFDVTCAKGMQHHERWTFTPKPEDVGAHPFTLAVYGEGNRLLAEASTVVQVVAPAAPAQVSVLMIGDSLTHHSVYPARVLEACAQDPNLKIRLIGTHAPQQDKPELRHEGYGGWTARSFVTTFSTEAWKDNRRACSPFVFAGADGKPVLDFARYCREQNEGKPPDVVTIFLGCNDTFGASEANQADVIAGTLVNFDLLINAIRAVGPNTAIGILLLAPPAASQDAFGANYGCGQTRWQYRRNQHRMVERTQEKYGKREAEGIWLLPTSVIVDPSYGFPTATMKANAYSAVDIVRLNNSVHPNEAGYRQIGDAVYAWIKDQATRRK
jgi:lysophospholipase L1-like esterase